jgi:hypothetical protein
MEAAVVVGPATPAAEAAAITAEGDTAEAIADRVSS